MESIVRTFHLDWKIILAQAVNFGIVLAVLYFFALKPLMKLLAERQEKIKRGVEDASSSAELLAKTQVEYEEALVRARQEAQAIFEAGKREAEAKRQAMLESAKTDALRVVDSGKKKLEEEKAKMVQDAKGEVVALSLQALEKLLREKGSRAIDEKLVKELSSL